VVCFFHEFQKHDTKKLEKMRCKCPLTVNFDIEKYYASRVFDILTKYGPTEQARLLIGTYTLIAMVSPDELASIFSKRTFYRHLEMLKASGIVFSDSYLKDIRKAYKQQKIIREGGEDK